MKQIIIIVHDENAFNSVSHCVAAWINGIAEPVAVTLLAVVDEEAIATASAFSGYFDIPREPGIKEVITQKMVEEQSQYLEELEALFSMEGITAKGTVRLGKLSEETRKEAVERKAYAIVVLADRRAMLFPASPLDEIVGLAPCPVVVFSSRLVRFSVNKKGLATKTTSKTVASLSLSGQ